MVVDGVYEIFVQTPMGKQKSKLTLTTSGNVLNGVHETPFGSMNITGTVSNNEIQWTENIESPMGSMSITFKGKVEGDQIYGQAIAPFGSIPFEGSRLQ